MNKLLLTVFILFLYTTINAEVFTILIYKEKHFPQDRYFYMTKSDGTKLYRSFNDLGNSDFSKFSDRQPFRATSYTISENGKYAILTFNPKKDSERNAIYAWQHRGLVKIMAINDVVSMYDAACGGYITAPRAEVIDSKFPDDFFVGESTTPYK